MPLLYAESHSLYAASRREAAYKLCDSVYSNGILASSVPVLRGSIGCHAMRAKYMLRRVHVHDDDNNIIIIIDCRHSHRWGIPAIPTSIIDNNDNIITPFRTCLVVHGEFSRVWCIVRSLHDSSAERITVAAVVVESR